MGLSYAIPGFSNGFAPRDGEGLYPGLNRGLIGQWVPTFGPTGLQVFDVSAYRNHGAITAATAVNAWTTSNGQWAYKSNATSDYIDCGSSVVNQMNTKTASLTAWIYKPTSTATGVVGFGQNVNHQFLINVLSGVTYFEADDGVHTNYPNVADTRTGWNHYAMSYNGNLSSMTGWINGVQQTLTLGGTAIGSSISVTGTFTIGRQQSATRFNSSGVLTDDVRLKNTSISDAEVKQLYTLGRGMANVLDDGLILRGPIGRLLAMRRKAVAA